MIMGRPRLGWLVTVGWGGGCEGTVAVVVAILAVSMLVVTNIAVGGADDLSIQIIRIYVPLFRVTKKAVCFNVEEVGANSYLVVL